MDLAASEIRVLGCLLEKQRTTPDAYPLTLNSLRLACNQSTNRDPIVAYQEDDVRDALHRLERRGFARFAGGAGSRAPKFRHLLAERLPMEDSEQAVICVLMLRGPQTPGELKQRAERLHSFAGLDEVHETLAALAERELVARLPRRPGQKEERYAQLLGGDPVEAPAEDEGTAAVLPAARPVSGAGAGGSAVQAEQVRRLSERVSALEAQVRRMADELGLELAEAEPPRSEPGGPDGQRSEDERTDAPAELGLEVAAEGGSSTGVPQ